MPTADALHFVGAATWAALSGQPVRTSVWDDVHEVPHVRLGQQADLVFVAPATADLLAQAAARPGRRPAHQRPCSPPAARWSSRPPCTPRCGSTRPPGPTWRTLRDRGCLVLEPAVGPAHRRRHRPGPAARARRALRGRPSGAGPRRRRAGARPGRPARAWSRAGGTREELDPVRFLGNWSSGRQGYALARTAAARGAEVTLVAANVALRRPGRASRSCG